MAETEYTDKLKLRDDNIEPGDEKLEIYTLGRFKVVYKSRVISEKARRSAKLWELFKYLLTNRDKSIPVENIIDSLWPERDYCDQNAALHTLTHRMRRMFFEEFRNGDEPFSLEVSQGCYRMRLNGNCWVDADEFAVNTGRASELSPYDTAAAVGLYRQAIRLYQGEYLPEYTARKWVLPAKRYYRHLYLQNLLGKIEICMNSGHYEEVCVLCERVFQVEQFVEIEPLHIYFMEALVRSGNSQQALCHYNSLTSSLYQEFGTRPSAAMRDLYRRMKPEGDSLGLNLRAVLDKMKEKEHVNGAFICDSDFFRFLYNLEMRRCERADKDYALALFSLKGNVLNVYEKQSINSTMDALEKILLVGLRKGDVITRWGNSQFLAFLIDIDQAGFKMALQRIKVDYSKTCKNNSYKLEVTRELELNKCLVRTSARGFVSKVDGPKQQ